MRVLTRSKKLLFNTLAALIDQVVIIVCGFILPRMFLTSYGSAINGLQASITQFLGIIVLCEMGVGAVVQTALYKPLAQKNELEISQIICSAERFFHKLGFFLAVYVFVLMWGYPLLIKNEFGYIYTASLILIISLSSFAHYFLGITYRLLLHADQLGFVPTALHSVCLLVNTALCVVLMKFGAGIHLVKFVSAILFILQPILLIWYVRKHYRINHHIKLMTEPIKQKWNGLAQHIASVVLNGTDMLVLTIFSTLDNVSVYSIYNLVVNGMQKLMISLTTGMQATLGNMLANEEWQRLTVVFTRFEWLVHTAVTLIFGITGILIVPFVAVYTQGITDANYIVPIFAALLVFAQALFCLRIPYSTLVLAAGHFKETQNSAILETVINVVLSIVLVRYLSLVGVVIGTLAAVVYRTLYFVWYLSRHILKRHMISFIKCFFVDIIVLFFMWLCTSAFSLQQIGYLSWLSLACKVSVVSILISIAINQVMFPQEMKLVWQQVKCGKLIEGRCKK